MTIVHPIYHRPEPCGLSTSAIREIADSHNPMDVKDSYGCNAVGLARDLGGDVDTFDAFSRVDLVVRAPGDFSIYAGSLRAGSGINNFICATALGHLLLHYPGIIDKDPSGGMQVPRAQDLPQSVAPLARREAVIFAHELLMPANEVLHALENGGREHLTTLFGVPKFAMDHRLKALGKPGLLADSEAATVS